MTDPENKPPVPATVTFHNKRNPTLEFRTAEHLDPREKRFVYLSTLETGWDGHAARAPDSAPINEARKLVTRLASTRSDFKEPAIVPTFNGSIQLEWHSAKRSLEFEFAGRTWDVLGVDNAKAMNPEFHEETISVETPEFLESFYSWFSKDLPEWPSQ